MGYHSDDHHAHVSTTVYYLNSSSRLQNDHLIHFSLDEIEGVDFYNDSSTKTWKPQCECDVWLQCQHLGRKPLLAIICIHFCGSHSRHFNIWFLNLHFWNSFVIYFFNSAHHFWGKLILFPVILISTLSEPLKIVCEYGLIWRLIKCGKPGHTYTILFKSFNWPTLIFHLWVNL